MDLHIRPASVLVFAAFHCLLMPAGLAPLLLHVRLELLLAAATADDTDPETYFCFRFICAQCNFVTAFHSRISDAEQHEA